MVLNSPEQKANNLRAAMGVARKDTEKGIRDTVDSIAEVAIREVVGAERLSTAEMREVSLRLREGILDQGYAITSNKGFLSKAATQFKVDQHVGDTWGDFEEAKVLGMSLAGTAMLYRVGVILPEEKRGWEYTVIGDRLEEFDEPDDEYADGNEDLTQAELALRGIVVKSIDQTFNMATLGTLEEIADRVIALVRSSTGISLFSPLLDGPPWPPVDGYATVEEVAEKAMNLGTNVVRATHVGPNDEEAFRKPPLRVGSTGPIGAAIFRSDGLILTESLAKGGVSVVHGLNTKHPIVQVWVNDMLLTPAVVFAPGPDRVMVRMGSGLLRDNHGLPALSANVYDKPMTVVIQG